MGLVRSLIFSLPVAPLASFRCDSRAGYQPARAILRRTVLVQKLAILRFQFQDLRSWSAIQCSAADSVAIEQKLKCPYSLAFLAVR